MSVAWERASVRNYIHCAYATGAFTKYSQHPTGLILTGYIVYDHVFLAEGLQDNTLWV